MLWNAAFVKHIPNFNNLKSPFITVNWQNIFSILWTPNENTVYLLVLTSNCREVGLCRFAAVIKTCGISLVQDPWTIVRTDVPEIQYSTLAENKS